MAIKETQFDRAERRLEALGKLVVLLHGLKNAALNHKYFEAVNAREEIFVIARSHVPG